MEKPRAPITRSSPVTQIEHTAVLSSSKKLQTAQGDPTSSARVRSRGSLDLASVGFIVLLGGALA